MSKKVYLVGAGPGDIELLTIKGMKLLNKADVVLYDALVNPEVFQFCKDDVIKVNVGKRKDHHLKKQDEINELIIQYAQKHETVVRLKGGTPFVFGRGYEEVRFIVKAGFEPVVVSGVSSTTSVLESFMIPSIDREFSDAYRTITGHDMKRFSEIITSFHARENLVIMMGVHNLRQIAITLLEKGYPRGLPIAILSKGTREDAQQVVSTLAEIEQKESLFFEQMKQLTPAIIFVGQTLNATQELITK